MSPGLGWSRNLSSPGDEIHGRGESREKRFGPHGLSKVVLANGKREFGRPARARDYADKIELF